MAAPAIQTGPPALVLSCPIGRVLVSRVKKSAASAPSNGTNPHSRSVDENSSNSAGMQGVSAWSAGQTHKITVGQKSLRLRGEQATSRTHITERMAKGSTHTAKLLQSLAAC